MDRRNKWSRDIGSQWHQGQFKSPDISSRLGFFGEVAFFEIMSTYFKSVPMYDISLHDKVRRVDFEWKTPIGSRHEIKTTVAQPEGEKNYVREKAVNRSDLFWFFSTSDIDCGLLYLRGYVSQDELLRRSQKRKGRGNWWNYQIATEKLNPVSQFLKLKRKAK